MSGRDVRGEFDCEQDQQARRLVLLEKLDVALRSAPVIFKGAVELAGAEPRIAPKRVEFLTLRKGQTDVDLAALVVGRKSTTPFQVSAFVLVQLHPLVLSERA